MSGGYRLFGLHLRVRPLQRYERIVKDQIQLSIRGALHFEVLIWLDQAVILMVMAVRFGYRRLILILFLFLGRIVVLGGYGHEGWCTVCGRLYG